MIYFEKQLSLIMGMGDQQNSNRSDSEEKQPKTLALQEQIEELESEIALLEANENLSSEEFALLKTHKRQLDELRLEQEAEEKKQNLSVRPLQRRDLQVISALIKDYPGFRQLPPEQQLDRMVFVLTDVCHFGGVTLKMIETLQDQISFSLKIDAQAHFNHSIWQNREGHERKRYVNNFGEAFKLDPAYKLKLLSEDNVDASSSEDKVVKKVPPKPKAEPEPEPEPQPRLEKKVSLESKVQAPSHSHSVMNEPKSISSIDDFQFSKPVEAQPLEAVENKLAPNKNPRWFWLVGGLIGLVVVILLFVTFA